MHFEPYRHKIKSKFTCVTFNGLGTNEKWKYSFLTVGKYDENCIAYCLIFLKKKTTTWKLCT